MGAPAAIGAGVVDVIGAGVITATGPPEVGSTVGAGVNGPTLKPPSSPPAVFEQNAAGAERQTKPGMNSDQRRSDVETARGRNISRHGKQAWWETLWPRRCWVGGRPRSGGWVLVLLLWG